jgi:hypothetical protein
MGSNLDKEEFKMLYKPLRDDDYEGPRKKPTDNP